MARADFRCPSCGYTEEHVFACAAGASSVVAVCPTCDQVRLQWVPMARFDLKTDGDGDRGFQKFEVSRLVPTREGPQQVTETVDSLHKLRQIEKDSEQRYRDGEGEPLRFRGYAQNRSNVDVGLFGKEGKIGDRVYDSGRTPQKSKKVGTKRHGQKKPKIAVAKGAGASPLG